MVILQAGYGKNLGPGVDGAEVRELLEAKRSPLAVEYLDLDGVVLLLLGQYCLQLGPGLGSCPSSGNISSCWVWSVQEVDTKGGHLGFFGDEGSLMSLGLEIANKVIYLRNRILGNLVSTLVSLSSLVSDNSNFRLSSESLLSCC